MGGFDINELRRRLAQVERLQELDRVRAAEPMPYALRHDGLVALVEAEHKVSAYVNEHYGELTKIVQGAKDWDKHLAKQADLHERRMQATDNGCQSKAEPEPDFVTELQRGADRAMQVVSNLFDKGYAASDEATNWNNGQRARNLLSTACKVQTNVETIRHAIHQIQSTMNHVSPILGALE